MTDDGTIGSEATQVDLYFTSDRLGAVDDLLGDVEYAYAGIVEISTSAGTLRLEPNGKSIKAELEEDNG